MIEDKTGFSDFAFSRIAKIAQGWYLTVTNGSLSGNSGAQIGQTFIEVLETPWYVR